MKNCPVIDTDLCKGCGLCIDACPKKIISLSSNSNSHGDYYPEITNMEECTACRFCVLICPDCAISLEEQ